MELTDGICEEYLEYIKSKCELSTNPLEKQLRISPIEIDGKTFEFSSDEAKNAEVLSDAMIAILQSDKFHLYRQNRAKPKINDEAPKVDSEKLPNKHKDNSNGKNKWNWWKLALLALAIALVIPLALYFFLKLPFGFDNIKPDTVESLWLLFWGDFIGAIASFLVVYQAYSDNKRFSKESELTRQQVATQSDIQILRDKYDRLEKIVIEANEIYSYRLLMKIYDEIDLYWKNRARVTP